MAEYERASGQDVESADDAHRFIRKLTSIAELSLEDRQAVLQLPIRIRTYDADQDIVREGDRPSECGLVLEGFAFRHKAVTEGGRQIMSFHPPGDVPDLQSLHLKTMDHSIGTLVPTKMGFIPHRAIEEVGRNRPGLYGALWRDALIDGSIFREWMLGLGRRSAYERLAHLVCEMALRMEAVGLGGRTGFRFPVTQSELADAVGLSSVHANRVVQELRRGELISWRGANVTIHNWEGLKDAAGFDPAYLHRLADD